MNRATFEAMMAQYKAEQISGEGIVSWDKGAHCVIPEVQICGKVVQDGIPTPDAPIEPVFSEGTTVECSGSIAVAPQLLAVSDAYCDTWNPQTGKGIRRIHKIKLSADDGWSRYSYNNGDFYKYAIIPPESYPPLNPPTEREKSYICTHLPSVNYEGLNNYSKYGIVIDDRKVVVKVDMSTLDEWLQFLQENDVYVWYVLLEPEEFQTDPQPLIQPHGSGSLIQTGGTVDSCPITVKCVTHS